MSGRGDETSARDALTLQELSAAVVHGIYRVVKACQFHTDVANDAVTSLTSSAAHNVADYCGKASVEQVAISFLGDAIFVNRQILKASRDTHALAAELRELLEVCGITELTLHRTVDRGAISVFAKLLADVQRDRSLVPRINANQIPGITGGKAMFAASGASREESPGQRAARTYATSVLTVQSVLSDVRLGKFELPRRVKRVAQQVVARADEDARMLVALAATGGVSMDAATVAVGSAILAVAMARQLTADRAVLANAAMTALLYDAGRVLLAFGGGDGAQRVLNDDELDRVPARSVAALTSLGRMHAPARARTALLYEVWSMRRAHRLGAVYKGRRPPTLLARIIGVARAFAELRGAGAGGGLSVDDALQMLGNRAADGTERALVKLLVGALGIYPAGTMVTLNTGELAVVMGTPDKPVDYVRPPVKVLYDGHANLLEEPFDVGLAEPGAEPMRFIVKAIDADDQQAKAMRAFVVKARAEKRRGSIEMELLARPIPEPTLQSIREDDAAGATKRPPVAVIDASSSGTPPALREDISPAPWRVPNLGEPTPRSGSRAAPAQPPAARSDRPRRRDPRNDSAPPSSMSEDLRGPERTTKPRALRPVENPDAETVRPPSSTEPAFAGLGELELASFAQLEEIGPPTIPPLAEVVVETLTTLPPARDLDALTTAPPPHLELVEVGPSAPPQLIELGPGTSVPPHLDTLPPFGPLGDLDELPRFENPELDSLFEGILDHRAPAASETRQTAEVAGAHDEHTRSTAPPPPASTKKEKDSARDAMLAAFLEDAPTDPPPAPATTDERLTPLVPRKR
ncbi:MAG: hypothetical protein JWP97_4664 [Labilithrix sp.]|nr:hypothetical protein [Labilithrix sp.]